MKTCEKNYAREAKTSTLLSSQVLEELYVGERGGREARAQRAHNIPSPHSAQKRGIFAMVSRRPNIEQQMRQL